MHHAHHLAGLFLNGSRTLGQGVSRYRQDGVGISTAPLVNVDSMPSVMAAPSTPPLPASAGLAALPVIESPEGARVTIGGRHYDWCRGNSYLGLQAHPDVLRAACEATLRYGLKLRDHRRVGCHPCVLEWERGEMRA